MAIKKPQLKSKAPIEQEEEAPKKLLKKKAPEPEPEEKPKKSLKKKSQSFAELFDSTKPATGGQDFPIGKFRVKVVSAEIIGEIDDGDQESDLAVKFTYEGLEDEAEGKTLTQQSTLFKDGEPRPQGIGFLKKDLDTLGYDGEAITLEDLAETLEDITATEPEVVIQTRAKDGFINAFLLGLAE